MDVFVEPEYIEKTQTGEHANTTRKGVQTRKCVCNTVLIELKTISNF